MPTRRTWVVHPQLDISLHRFAHMVPRHIPPLGQPQYLKWGGMSQARVSNSRYQLSKQTS